MDGSLAMGKLFGRRGAVWALGGPTAMVLLGVLFGALPGTALSGELADNWAWCEEEDGDPERRRGACAWLLDNGRLNRADNAKAHYNRGWSYRDKGQFERALADYDEAIRLKPDYAEAYNGRGIAYKQKGRYARAIADYDTALRLEPNYVYAYNNRGNAYSDQGRYDHAIQDLGFAILLKPDYTLAYFNRGLAFNRKGQYERAIKDLDAALRLDPKLAIAFTERGNVYLARKQYARAIAEYDAAIALDPEAALPHNNLAWLLATAADAQFRDGARALTLAQRAVRLIPSSDNFDTLAAAQARAGHFQDAVAAQDRSIAKLRAAAAPAAAIARQQARRALYQSGKPYSD